MSDKLKKIVKKEILEKQIGGKGILGPAAAPANSPPFVGGTLKNVGDFRVNF